VVNGTSDSYLGGFVGINVGAITDSTATAAVTAAAAITSPAASSA